MATFIIDSFLVDWGCWGIGAFLFLSYYYTIEGIAVITGGSTGIGRALASVLAAAHYDLILVARSINELKQAQYQLQHTYQVQVHIISKDLATPTAGQELFDEIGKMGLVDKVTILINNAGFGTVGAFLSTPLNQITNQINVNLNTLTTLTHLFGNQFKTNGGGKILQVASTAAFQPGPNMATYYATKAFVTSLSDALAYELRTSNVTISTLCPGPVLSAFGARAGNDVSPLFKYGPVATAEATARVAWEGVLRGDRLIIPFPNHFSVLGVRIFPRSLMMVVANWLNSGEQKH